MLLLLSLSSPWPALPRLQREAEKAKQREKDEKEEAVWRAQEALEERLEKYAVRRLPLGSDRHHRRYWWGLAGHRGEVWVEDAEVRACGQRPPLLSLPLCLQLQSLKEARAAHHTHPQTRLCMLAPSRHDLTLPHLTGSHLCRAAGAPSPRWPTWMPWSPRWTSAACGRWPWARCAPVPACPYTQSTCLPHCRGAVSALATNVAAWSPLAAGAGQALLRHFERDGAGPEGRGGRRRAQDQAGAARTAAAGGGRAGAPQRPPDAAGATAHSLHHFSSQCHVKLPHTRTHRPPPPPHLQVDFFDPAAKHETAGGSRGASGGLAALMGPAECAAAAAMADGMLEIQKSAGALLAPPQGGGAGGSWKDWAAAIKAAAVGQLDEGSSSGKPTAVAVRNLLRVRAAASLGVAVEGC